LSDEYAQVKISYVWPLIILVIGVILLSIHGTKPFYNYYKKNHSWIKLDATYERGGLITVDGPKSITVKNTGSRYKIRFVLKYHPRKLFGSAIFDQKFPAWLKLPNQSFLWTETPENYEGIIDAQKALAGYMSQRNYKIWMNPKNPRDSFLFTWNKWMLVQLGLMFSVLGLLGFGLVLIVNSRKDRIAEKRILEALELSKTRVRHHNKKSPPPPKEFGE
jgi:hypothetical protein